ncbi:hypothetical protein OBBRIDRAFT_334318 [Obba rivulosa]|uniref:Uncharacterized protein n=1 Tax=Obba rivulosa TaxID=1052685 RepID=A0A8E2AR19_9APHY|nr:hypothetical protein OBBRIDRAFT_334318 [Obba rivulosa]
MDMDQIGVVSQRQNVVNWKKIVTPCTSLERLSFGTSNQTLPQVVTMLSDVILPCISRIDFDVMYNADTVDIIVDSFDSVGSCLRDDCRFPVLRTVSFCLEGFKVREELVQVLGAIEKVMEPLKTRGVTIMTCELLFAAYASRLIY